MPSAATPSKASSKSTSASVQGTNLPPASHPGKDATQDTSTAAVNGSSAQTPSQASKSAGPTTETAPSVAQASVSVPHTPVPAPTSRMPFTNQSMTTAFPRQPTQSQPQAYNMPSTQPLPPASRPRTEHLNPAELLAQFALTPRVNPPTPTAPSHQSIPSPVPPQTAAMPGYQNHGFNWGPTQQHSQQPQARAPPPGQWQPQHHQQYHQHPPLQQYQQHYQQQNPQQQPPPPPQQQHQMQAQPSLPPPHQTPEGDVPLPDVPADSTALVERMMQNLRRAAFQG